jgi:hypothetical protein
MGDKTLMRLKSFGIDRYNEYIMTGLRTIWGGFRKNKTEFNPIWLS